METGRLASKALQPVFSQFFSLSLLSEAMVPIMGTRPVSWAYFFSGFFFISLQHSALILNGALNSRRHSAEVQKREREPSGRMPYSFSRMTCGSPRRARSIHCACSLLMTG